MKLESKMFNMKKSPHDDKDYLLSVDVLNDIKPDLWVNTKSDNIAYNQGQTSMCAGYSCAGIMSQLDLEINNTYQRFSPASVYGNREGDSHQGEGQYLKAILKDMRVDGIAKFEDMPFIGSVEDCKQEFLNLTEEIRKDMTSHRIKFFYKVNHDSIEEMYEIMKKFNKPLIISYGIYQSMVEGFYNGGYIPMPNEGEKMLGGHASYIGGFVNHDGQLKPAIVNSWGDDIFDNGIMYMPENFPIWEAYLCMPQLDKEIRIKPYENYYRVNGEVIRMDTQAIIRNDRMLLPLRPIMETLDVLSVSWVQASKTAIVRYGGDSLYFKAGEQGFDSSILMKTINYEEGDRVGLTTNYIDEENSRMLVPLRKVFEFCGFIVDWDNETKEVIIRNY